MADQGVIEYDAFDMEKMPTDTLKRNPKNMDLTKTELLRLLSYLEGELQGRDVTIAALKAEKAKQLMYQAKYGRFGLGDPFQALQRDSEWQKDQSFDETAVKSMYDNQLMQLENLIETQRKAQLRMREQLAAVEKRYHKVCAELEDEKRRHAQDAEEGDNVTCMLEKERERLKQELEFEKTQNKKLEKELKKTNISTEEEKGMADKHKVVAVELIKERNKLIEKLIVLHQRNKQLEQTLKDEQDKTKEMAEGLAHKGQLALQLEANLEKNLSDYDTEREQLKLKLSREESKNRELTLEVEKLKFQIEQMQRHLEEQPIKAGSQATEIINDSNKASKNSLSVNSTEKKSSSPNVSVAVSPTVSPRSMQVGKNKIGKNKSSPGSSSGIHSSPEVHNIPVVHIKNTHDGKVVDTTVGNKLLADSPSLRRTLVKGEMDGSILSESILGKEAPTNDRTSYYVSSGKPIPAEKPVELQGTKVNVPSSVLNISSGTTVFTTPSGTKISLNVGPSSPGSGFHSPVPTPRKFVSSSSAFTSSASSTISKPPPPVPPNKPQVFIPQNIGDSNGNTQTPLSVYSSKKMSNDGNSGGPLSPRSLQSPPPPQSRSPGAVPIPIQHQTSSKMSPRFSNLPFVSAVTSPGGRASSTGHPRDVRKPPPQVSLFK